MISRKLIDILSPAGLALIGLLGMHGVALAQEHEEERSRLLIVFAPNEDAKPLIAEYEALQRDVGELGSSDVDVIYVVGDHSVKLPPPDAKTESAENMRKRYHVDADGFRIVLIGKDGWEKARWSEPTDPEKILSRAQDMPKPKSALDPQH
jgi:hypothetical protein